MATYKDRGITLRRSKFTFEKDDLQNVDLWNLSPVWPGKEKAKLDKDGLIDLMRKAYGRSSAHSRMVLWMPASELHKSPVDPIESSLLWSAEGTILSGSNPMHIGFIYSKAPGSIKWDTKLILDERGKRGQSSGLTMRFVLESVIDRTGTLVVDPFAHKSGTLPIWCRRLGIHYCGYMASKKNHSAIIKTLAQIELPGIQLPVPAIM